MKISKQTKLYGAILALALIGLGADRFAFSSTAEPTEESSDLLIAQDKPAAAAPVASSGVTLSARLEAVATAQQLRLADVRDAFKPSDSWFGAAVITAADVVPTAQKNQEQIDAFYRSHRLNAVMKTSRGGLAIIDGKTFTKGQQIDGLTIVSIDEHSVTLQSSQVRAELKLEGIEPAATQKPTTPPPAEGADRA